jgi:malate synthase
MAQPDPDDDIYQLINALSEEEERLWASAGDGRGLDPEERRRLEVIKIELDRAYDLLHQRAALRAAGRDPSEARERPADVVERYQQ